MRNKISQSAWDLTWETQYKKLVAYKTRHGHCRVPQRYEDRTLASWVATQRVRKQKGSLSEERIYALNSIGFVWKIFQTSWDKQYDRLLAYRLEYGHCRVTVNDSDQKLLRWVNTQRILRAQGALSQTQMRKLDGIDFDWHDQHAIWKTQPEKLVFSSKLSDTTRSDGSSSIQLT